MEHQRIDEGVKRGARHNQPPANRPTEGLSRTIPDDLNPDHVLAEFLVAGKTSGIALKYGLRRAAVTRWMQKIRPIEWKEVQKIRALCTKEDGTEQIYDARSALQLSRARELLRAGQWDLERLDPSNYGVKQEVAHTFTGPVIEIHVVAAVGYQQGLLPDLPKKEAENAIDVDNQEDAV